MGEEPTASEKKVLLASVDRILGVLERQEALIQELSLLTRLGAAEQAREFFEGVLDSDSKKWVYEALDGQATQATIEARTRVDQAWVSRWGREWEALGIVVDVGRGKRRRVIPLSALGIHVAAFPKKS